MFKKPLLYIMSTFLCLFFLTSCDEEETDSGTGSNGGTSTSIYSDSDFVGTVWKEAALDFAGMMTTSEDVSVLDAWSPAIDGDFSIIFSDDPGDSSTTTISLTYLNVEVDTDSEDGNTVTNMEFEISSHSEWNESDNDEYYELEISCYDGDEYDEYNNNSPCNISFESDYFNFWSSVDEDLFSWDPDTYTLTIHSDFIYSDEWEGKTLTIPSGSFITAGTMSFESGVPVQLMSDSETIDPWETRIWEFNENGTITSEYSTDCSLVDAEENWDCYDSGCGVVINEVDEVVGCQDIDCESFTSEDDCYSAGACDWSWEDDACEGWGDNSSPEGFTWEIIDDQMILTPGEDADANGPQTPMTLDIVAMNDESLVLELNIEMCQFYGGYYMGYLYFMYYDMYGYGFGTGDADGYYANYFADLADNLCSYIYEDFSDDIYGLEGDQVEAVHQSQTISFISAEWPSMRASRKTKNSIISPKLFNRILK